MVLGLIILVKMLIVEKVLDKILNLRLEIEI